MYHAIFPDGRIECREYETNDDGVDLYDEDGERIAFVPFANLHALIDEGMDSEEDSDIHSVM